MPAESCDCRGLRTTVDSGMNLGSGFVPRRATLQTVRAGERRLSRRAMQLRLRQEPRIARFAYFDRPLVLPHIDIELTCRNAEPVVI